MQLCYYQNISAKNIEIIGYQVTRKSGRNENQEFIVTIFHDTSQDLYIVIIQVQKQEDLLESSTDALEWKMEVERVMPSLKVHLRSDKVTIIILCTGLRLLNDSLNLLLDSS